MQNAQVIGAEFVLQLIVAFNLISEILGRVGIKLEDRVKASQFRMDLREVSAFYTSSVLLILSSGGGPLCRFF